jgi:hypothetical protein
MRTKDETLKVRHKETTPLKKIIKNKGGNFFIRNFDQFLNVIDL